MLYIKREATRLPSRHIKGASPEYVVHIPTLFRMQRYKIICDEQ